MSGGTEIARLFGVESPKTQNEDQLWEHGLLLRGKRLELLADNMANADTPNYKARDFKPHFMTVAHAGKPSLHGHPPDTGADCH